MVLPAGPLREHRVARRRRDGHVPPHRDGEIAVAAAAGAERDVEVEVHVRNMPWSGRASQPQPGAAPRRTVCGSGAEAPLHALEHRRAAATAMSRAPGLRASRLFPRCTCGPSPPDRRAQQVASGCGLRRLGWRLGSGEEGSEPPEQAAGLLLDDAGDLEAAEQSASTPRLARSDAGDEVVQHGPARRRAARRRLASAAPSSCPAAGASGTGGERAARLRPDSVRVVRRADRRLEQRRGAVADQPVGADRARRW